MELPNNQNKLTNYIMCKNTIFLIFTLMSTCLIGQSTFSLKDIQRQSSVTYSLSNNGTYRNMNVAINNRSSITKKAKVECGTIFKNSNSSEQNLVVLFYDELSVNAGYQKSAILVTACMDAAKRAPSSSSSWTIDYDQGIGRLIEYYHSFRPMIAALTGPKHHETKEKQTHFLQMAVWSYYKCDKKHIVDFSAKYMFDGDREAAEQYVEVTYPLIELFIEQYKLVYRD